MLFEDIVAFYESKGITIDSAIAAARVEEIINTEFEFLERDSFPSMEVV